MENERELRKFIIKKVKGKMFQIPFTFSIIKNPVLF